MNSLRIAFAGTGEFAVPVLASLARAWRPLVVITQPDRPAGRGLATKPPPVKQAAQELGLPVYQPASINSQEALERLRDLKLDLLAVAAYGQILKKDVLGSPRLGCINVHASLLPQYRGAAPVAWAIASGEEVTGVTVFLMDEGMDTGPILLQRQVQIDPEETRGELEARLAVVGGELLVEAIRGYVAGDIQPKPQPAEGTLAPRLKKQDGEIDWSWPARRVHDWVRAMNPWPAAFTHFRGRLLKIHRTRMGPEREGLPGALRPEGKRLFVVCGEGTVELLEVQPEGKRRMSTQDFLNGYRPRPGERLSPPGT